MQTKGAAHPSVVSGARVQGDDSGNIISNSKSKSFHAFGFSDENYIMPAVHGASRRRLQTQPLLKLQIRKPVRAA